MRVYRRYSGLHAESENQAERAALAILWRSPVRGRVAEEIVENGAGSTFSGRSSVHGIDGIVAGQEVSPGGVIVDLRDHDAVVVVEETQ